MIEMIEEFIIDQQYHVSIYSIMETYTSVLQKLVSLDDEPTYKDERIYAMLKFNSKYLS